MFSDYIKGWETWTPKQRMNYWVGEQKRVLQTVINHTGENESRSYLRGVLSGLDLLSDQWLHEVFEGSQQAGDKDG